MHVQLIRVARFLTTLPSCKASRRNSWISYQVHPCCTFFDNAFALSKNMQHGYKFQEKLVHTMFYSQDELEFNLREEQPEAHLIEVVFEDRGDKSWVKFSQFGEMDQEQAEASREGMESYLENLAIYFSR